MRLIFINSFQPQCAQQSGKNLSEDEKVFQIIDIVRKAEQVLNPSRIFLKTFA